MCKKKNYTQNAKCNNSKKKKSSMYTIMKVAMACFLFSYSQAFSNLKKYEIAQTTQNGVNGPVHEHA